MFPASSPTLRDNDTLRQLRNGPLSLNRIWTMQLNFPVYLRQLRRSVGTLLITKFINRVCWCSPIGVLSSSSKKTKSQ
jgi:hypothetical protein